MDKLRRAEELLLSVRRAREAGPEFDDPSLNAGVNAAAGIVTKAAFDQSWGSALITFATGQAVSLLNIFTQPMRATRDLKRYEKRATWPRNRLLLRASWSLSLWPGGIGFRSAILTSPARSWLWAVRGR